MAHIVSRVRKRAATILSQHSAPHGRDRSDSQSTQRQWIDFKTSPNPPELCATVVNTPGTHFSQSETLKIHSFPSESSFEADRTSCDPVESHESPPLADSTVATAKDHTFHALFMKRISRPMLISTTNECVRESEDANVYTSLQAAHEDYATRSMNEHRSQSHAPVREQYTPSFPGNKAHQRHSGTSSSCTVLSILQLLDQCDAEFLEESTRLRETITETKSMIKRIQRERKQHKRKLNSSNYCPSP